MRKLMISLVALFSFGLASTTVASAQQNVGQLTYRKESDQFTLKKGYTSEKLYNHVPNGKSKNVKVISWKQVQIPKNRQVKSNMTAYQGTRYAWYRLSLQNDHHQVRNYWLYGDTLKLKK